MIVDHTVSPKQNVVNCINETNSTTFTAEDFDMLELTQIDFTGDVKVLNSTVLATCTLNNPYYGNRLVKYRRLYVQEIIRSSSYTLQTGDTLASILLSIATRYQMIPSELEWDASTLNVPAGTTKPYTLRAKIGSLCYVGQLAIQISKT